jgi:hypothetical protein
MNARLSLRYSCALLVLLSALPLARSLAAPPAAAGTTCLPGERGYFQAHLRGAIELQTDWRGTQLACEGGARPDARGLRLSFIGRLPNSQHTLRIVFGISAAAGALRTRDAPANITVIVEGDNRIYSTLGDGKCTIEALVQEALPEAHGYRVAARGYCTAPAVAVGGNERLYIDRFDFAGRAQLTEQDLAAISTPL